MENIIFNSINGICPAGNSGKTAVSDCVVVSEIAGVRLSVCSVCVCVCVCVCESLREREGHTRRDGKREIAQIN